MKWLLCRERIGPESCDACQLKYADFYVVCPLYMCTTTATPLGLYCAASYVLSTSGHSIQPILISLMDYNLVMSLLVPFHLFDVFEDIRLDLVGDQIPTTGRDLEYRRIEGRRTENIDVIGTIHLINTAQYLAWPAELTSMLHL